MKSFGFINCFLHMLYGLSLLNDKEGVALPLKAPMLNEDERIASEGI